MGLIKRSKIEDKGEILLKSKSLEVMERPQEYLEAPPLEVERFEPLAPGMEATEAEAKALEIIKDARDEAELIRSKSREDGLNQGRLEADEKIKESLKTLNQAVVERKKIIKDAEGEILRLALKAAEQIIRSEVSLHRDVCLNIVSDAINRVSDREQIIVRVNREDAEYIKRYKDRLSGIVDGVKSFSILEDSQIEPGGCVIETNLGYVDARISTKLESLSDALKKVSEEGEHQ